MSKYSQGGIQAIKQRLDIVELVRKYVDLRQVGGRFVAPCPFHQETKPSFSVNPDLGHYYCFGCQASGDVIDFYCNIHGLEFREGLYQLADELGIELTRAKPDPGVAKKKHARAQAVDIHRLANELYIRFLDSPAGKTAADYLKKRGLSREVVRAFGLGYSADDWHSLEKFIRAKGYSAADGVSAGLLVKNEKGNVYDRFRGRLMFPIHNLSGQIIAFGARTLTGDDPKYLNSSDSVLYSKGEHLYGLYQARRSIAHLKEALLTEGYTDVLSLHQFGFTNACGVLGTALTEKQIKRLGGFCPTITLVFDADGAGKKAALRSAEMILTQGLSCKVVLLPEGEDVDSLLQAKGAEAFKVLLGEAQEGLDYCLHEIGGRSTKQVVDWAHTFLRSLSDPQWRSPLISRIAKRLGFREEDFRRKLSQATPEQQRHRQQENSEESALRPASTGPLAEKKGRAFLDRQLMRFAVCYPEYVERFTEMGMAEVLESEFALCLWEKIAANPGRDIMHILTPHEKKYVVECLETNTGTPEQKEQEWVEICEYFERERLTDEGTIILEALRKAQATGDSAEIKRLLEKQQEILRRRNGQY